MVPGIAVFARLRGAAEAMRPGNEGALTATTRRRTTMPERCRRDPDGPSWACAAGTPLFSIATAAVPSVTLTDGLGPPHPPAQAITPVSAGGAATPGGRAMRRMDGPAPLLAQLAGDAAPFGSRSGIARRAAGCGRKGVRVPSRDARLLGPERAAESKDRRDELRGRTRLSDVELTTLSTPPWGPVRRGAFGLLRLRRPLGPRRPTPAADMGCRVGAPRARGLAQPRDLGDGRLSRRAGLALRPSPAVAAPMADRAGLRAPPAPASAAGATRTRWA